MNPPASARRVPRQIGGPDEENAPLSSAQPDSAVKRPSAKLRKSSSLRRSFGPSAVDDEEDSEAVVTPKRKDLCRVAVQRNAAKRRSFLATPLPRRDAEYGDERPSYSAASLQQLKNSTPSVPQNFRSASNTDVEDVSRSTPSLDLSSKFGSSLARSQPSSGSAAIPSAAEIAEKKARRARLAKEQQAEEYISLDPDDPALDDDEDLDPNVMRDEQGKLVLKPTDKYGRWESRLVHDDEDMMENFEDFTDDGRIALGRKAEAEAERKRRQDMAAQIAEAECASDDDSDDSERERREAYEAVQTKHGSYARTPTDTDAAHDRPKTPPIITPLPTLDGAIERLRKQLSDMQTSRMQRLQEMENLQREKIRLAEEEVRIQRALKETAHKFEQLRREKGIGVATEGPPAIEASAAIQANGEGIGVATEGPPAIEASAAIQANGEGKTSTPKGGGEMEDAQVDDNAEVGAEEAERPSFGGGGFGVGLGVRRVTSNGGDKDEDEAEDDARPAFGGLRFGASRGNLAGFGLGFHQASRDEDGR